MGLLDPKRWVCIRDLYESPSLCAYRLLYGLLMSSESYSETSFFVEFFSLVSMLSLIHDSFLLKVYVFHG